MDPLLAWAQSNRPAIIGFIRDLVECESPSDQSQQPFFDLFASHIADIADCEIQRGVLLCHFRTGASAASRRILALGHSDTVWPVGTLARMPFREDAERLCGPGVLDMKAGLAFFVFAIRALHHLGIAVPHRALLQINPDEETGSRESRAVTEANARQSAAVLVLEPGTGLEGRAKTARKGIGLYKLQVRGVASHSGVDFEKGASAVIELARQIDRIAAFTDVARGITVNPGVISGGTRSNVIAAEAQTEIDVRVPTLAAAQELDRRFRSLTPFHPLCSLHLSGGLNRPPMERTPGVVALFEQARGFAREFGVDLAESSTGGGSDGNFTAALGIPTLDGLGAVGEGAHADHESILVNRIADRVALLAKLISGLAV